MMKTTDFVEDRFLKVISDSLTWNEISLWKLYMYMYM